MVMVIENVPFYENTPDGTHCYQAVIRSTLKYFEPEKEFSWKQLDTITAKVEGLWTWPMAGELWLQEHGYDVAKATLFDYKRFAALGGQYLIEKNGREVAEKQIANSNIPQEQRIARAFLDKGQLEKRAPSYQELPQLLDLGKLVICNVNSCALNEKGGFVGHFVLAVGYDESGLIIHDPGGRGKAGQAYRHVPEDVFEAAWAYPNEQAKHYTAVGKVA